MYINIYESLCFIPEMNTILWMNNILMKERSRIIVGQRVNENYKKEKSIEQATTHIETQTHTIHKVWLSLSYLIS